jgi:transposase
MSPATVGNPRPQNADARHRAIHSHCPPEALTDTESRRPETGSHEGIGGTNQRPERHARTTPPSTTKRARKLFAALNVHDGTVAGWVTDSTRAENFVAFLTDLVAQTPSGMQLHCIVDNLSAHGTPAVEAFLDDHPQVFLHRTPTHASWLNQVELWFSIMERRLIRNGEFNSVDHLADRIIEFMTSQ